MPGKGWETREREREEAATRLDCNGGLRFQPPLIDGWYLFNLFNGHLSLNNYTLLLLLKKKKNSISYNFSAELRFKILRDRYDSKFYLI